MFDVDYDQSGSAAVMIKYDATDVKDPSDLAIFYYNETYGLFLPLDSTVDTINDTVYANIPQPCMLAGFDAVGRAAMYGQVSDFNEEISGYMSPAVVVHVNGDVAITLRSAADGGTISVSKKTVHVL